MKLNVFPVLLILLFGTPAFADLQKGLDAASRGDFATALEEWIPLAEQGDADAQYYLGVMYIHGQIHGVGVTQDYKSAFKWYKLAADQGDAEAQYSIGRMYNNGLGVIQDYMAAFKWYKLAADQGQARAQYFLGVMYDKGLGVIQDYTLAHMWLNIAASQGDIIAAKNRRTVEHKMTPTQIEEAQKLARECIAKNYKGC